MIDETDELGATRAHQAFAALANEHRMEIVETLWNRRSTHPTAPDEPTPFSTLFEATSLDDKGQFNYHLGKLVGAFLARSADGYTLTHAGRNLARAVQAGSVTDDPTVENDPVEERACPYCDEEAVVMHYADGVVLFSCTECDGMAPEDPMAPPGAIQAGTIPGSALVERNVTELYDTAVRWGSHVHRSLQDGYCPACAGSVTDRLHLCDDHDTSEGACGSCGDRFAARIRYECVVCGTVEWFPVWGRLVTTEPLFGFLYDRDINPHEPQLADFALARDLSETVVSYDPPAVEYGIVVDGDKLYLRVDDGFEVTALDDGTGMAGPGVESEV
jgi:hypothetical protein